MPTPKTRSVLGLSYPMKLVALVAVAGLLWFPGPDGSAASTPEPVPAAAVEAPVDATDAADEAAAPVAPAVAPTPTEAEEGGHG
ncbi:MAG: hypothetical protein HKO98_05325, partial [Gemmatimonadetes bacterium]|nr:hypothetical protein [Gemmatimonadota bacterium]